MTRVTLRNLGNRLALDTDLLSKNADDSHKRELLEKKIAETKNMIIQCVLENSKSENPHLDNIYL